MNIKRLLPISFIQQGIPYRGMLRSLNDSNTSFSLHLNDVWVATIAYTDNWVMDGRFTALTGFIGNYIETYFLQPEEIAAAETAGKASGHR